MTEFIITTFDWVPEMPRGHVRDLRLRWALEEAGLPYRVDSTPFSDRPATHFAHQPFGQVPWLRHGDQTLFESGAILLYITEHSDRLMPRSDAGRYRVTEWLFAALNSLEPASVPWSLFQFSGDTAGTPGRQHLDQFLTQRLEHMDRVLREREWLAESFSVADIAMVDALRLVDRFDALEPYPASRDYIARATVRPAFVKAHADQLAFFRAADSHRA